MREYFGYSTFNRFGWLVYILTFASASLHAQEEKSETEVFKKHHALGVVIAHTTVFHGSDEAGNRETLILPSWALNYNFHFHPRWAIGIHTDMIVETFVVETGFGSDTKEEVERKSPIAPALVGSYNFGKGWTALLGFGAEFAHSENFLLNRFGIEYTAEIRHHWEVFGVLNYDIKWKGYDSWMLGLGVAKKFGGK